MAKSIGNKGEDPGKRNISQTFRMKEELLYKIKYIAFHEDISQADVLEGALNDYFAKYEKKSGPIPPKK